MSILIAPSLLSANFLHLAKDVEMVNESMADLFHLDVMDGHFVPNITFGFSIISQIKSIAAKPLDVHLMMTNPECFLEEFKAAGADMLSVHYETCSHLHSTVTKIKHLGMKAGVVINPHNPVFLLRDIMPFADYVLLMSVNPGFGGQQFIQNTLQRIQELKQMKSQLNPDLQIEVDGGVSLENASALIAAGADILVSGNAIFGSSNPKAYIQKLKYSG